MATSGSVRGRGMRGGVLLALLAVGAVGGSPAAARGASPATFSDDTPAPCPAATVDCPSRDVFYAAPSNLASLADGAIIATRPAVIAESSITAQSAAYTVSYRSEDQFGKPVMDITTVLLPSASYAGTGRQPLVSVQLAEDSLGGQCGPAYALAHPNVNVNIDSESGNANSLLQKGYVVALPDHEGPAHQFEVGRQQGHAVLDGLRATLSLPAAKLSPSTPIGITGYSGGANATGWADELAATYAPELDIVGAAHGGTAADLTVTGKALNGGAFFGLDVMAAGAVIRGLADSGLDTYLNPAGHQLLKDAATECVGDALQNHALRNFDEYTTAPGLLDDPDVQKILAVVRLGQAAPRFPIFQYHALTDEIVPYANETALADYYCSQGVTDQFVTLIGDHLSAESSGASQVLAFLQARFDGAPATSTCTNPGARPPAPPAPGAKPAPPVPKPTLSRPTISRLTKSTARLRAKIDTHGRAVSYRFVFSTAKADFGRKAKARRIPAGVGRLLPATATVTKLRHRSAYHCRLVASYLNVNGRRTRVTGPAKRFVTK